MPGRAGGEGLDAEESWEGSRRGPWEVGIGRGESRVFEIEGLN